MTNQEVFDKVVTALRKQGAKSQSHGCCAYRGRWGRKCAVGHLIPDELYDENMEGKLWVDLSEWFPAVDNLQLNRNLVQELQLIHDDHRVRDWEDYWRDLAYRYNLTYTPSE